MRRDLEPLREDVLPHVELGPVRDREHAHVLAPPHAAVVEAPQLRALAPRVPLAEVVAEARRSAPSRARAPRRGARRRTPRRSRARRSRRAASSVCSRLRDARGPVSSTTRPWSIESCTEATISRSPSSATRRSRNSIASGKLWPVSTCMTGNGNGAGPERLLGQPQQHDRVLAAGEQQHGVLELGGDLAHDVDRLRLQHLEVGRRGGGSAHVVCAGRWRPHSIRSVPAQRPSRPAPGTVQWVQPIDSKPRSCSGL